MARLWNPLHFVLTLIVTLILIITYRNIAKALDKSFWDPLYEQISIARSSLHKLCSPTTANCDKVFYRSNADNNLELSSATEKVESSEKSVTCLSVEENRERSRSNCTVQNGLEISSDSSSKHRSTKQRTNDQRKITSVFFFASFMFIVLALPTITIEIILNAYFRFIEYHWTLLYGAVLCQKLFSLVFLINPFVYMLNSSFVIQKLNHICTTKGENTEILK